jgi:hypothetical protein
MGKQHIIAYRNNKGGVARTTLAAHTLFLGAELGLKVAGVSLDEQNDLALWMQGANLPWFNGLCDDLPTDFDLLVFDVRKNSPLDEVLCLGVNLWLLPVDNTTAEEAALRLAPTLRGPSGERHVYRVCSYCHGDPPPEHEWSPELDSLNVVVRCCGLICAAATQCVAVWSTPLGAHSDGARALRAHGAEVLNKVGLLPPTHRVLELPPVPTKPLAEQEREGAKRLAAFFASMATVP